jgi:hypothetical protein
MTKQAPKLHELLAAEKTVVNASNLLLKETEAKFGKDHFFAGNDKTLTLIDDSPAKDAMERAARETRPLTTTVPATLGYFFSTWAKAEDLLFQKNKTNQTAIADIEFEGSVIASGVPVDELLGLESRLEILRGVIQKVPTLDASKKWVKDTDSAIDHVWKTAEPEVATKTEKDVSSVVLYPATEKHPAQIKEISKDVVKGSFSNTRYSGAITSRAKADALKNIDTLIAEVKKARTRANNVDVQTVNIGNVITNLIMGPIMSQQQ